VPVRPTGPARLGPVQVRHKSRTSVS
jgi:hypothetical protein